MVHHIQENTNLYNITFQSYSDKQECEGLEICDKGQWYTTAWSDCSAIKCGEEGGLKKRKVAIMVFLMNNIDTWILCLTV